MSTVSAWLRGKITFQTAIERSIADAEKLIASDPTSTQAAGAMLSATKQAASDAISLADTALGAVLMPAAQAVEVALDTALNTATKGVTVPLNPITDAFIDQAARTLKQAADAWALAAKAKLAAPPAPKVVTAPVPAPGSAAPATNA